VTTDSSEIPKVVDGQTLSGHATTDGGWLSDDGTVYVDSHNNVEHGRTTDAGMFETSQVVDGHTMWGTPTTNGGWMSEDGKVYVDPDHTIEHGIKAPDGTFIPNGSTDVLPDGTTLYGTHVGNAFYTYDGSTIVLGDQTVVHGHLDDKTGIFTADNGSTYGVTDKGIFSGTAAGNGSVLLSNGQSMAPETQRVIDGQTVSGYATTDGGWMSADGTIHVDANGAVEHGRTTADGMFETSRVVDGQTMWGSPTTNGGWMSEDGKVYIDPDNNVQHGIKAPDGTFIQNGTTHKLSDGTTLYGTAVGSSFYTSDGSTIVLGDGTVVHGHLDTSTGIFTGDNGSTYGVTDDGIYTGTVQDDDGSVLLGNGETLMTPGAWAIDLQKMADAITTVKTKSGSIDGHVTAITGEYTKVSAKWSSPAGETFADVTKKASTAMTDMQTMLTDMVSRMQLSHDNYYNTEVLNTKNVQNHS
jgi:uncharacterized protein YukE